MMTKSLSFFLVDDDPDDVEFFEDVLTELEPAVRFGMAENGQEALDKLAQMEVLPDLIFLDLNMPRMDGKECLKHIKADPRLQQIPVIIYSTSSQPKDVEETRLSGAVCFITKPSSINELKKILSSIAGSLPGNLEESLRLLGKNNSFFIVC